MRRAETLALEDMAFLDSGALEDPLVAGVDHPRQLGIGEHVGRHVAMHAGDRRADRGVLFFGLFRHTHARLRGSSNAHFLR
jgi:hypothetical protein